MVARSGGRCEFVGADGGRCRHPGEHLHHVRRRSQGGRDSEPNLRHLCFEHHALVHARPEWAAGLGLLELAREPLSSAVTRVERVTRG